MELPPVSSYSSDEFDVYPETHSIPEIYKGAIAGNTVLMTGVAEGRLGDEAVLTIASANPSMLILSSRNQACLRATATHIASCYPSVKVKLLPVDLRSLASVRKAALEIESWVDVKIDILVNNAAIMDISSETMDDDEEEGFESQFEVCHLGHFLLTNLLLRAHLFADCNQAANEKGVSSACKRQQTYDQAETATMLFSVALSNAWNLQMRNMLRYAFVR